MKRRRETIVLLVATVLAGCAGPGSDAASRGGESRSESSPKRITAAILGEPAGISSVFIATGSGTYPGGESVEALLEGSLTSTDRSGVEQGLLSDAAPSLENGLWKVFPDGRMETTWRIRDTATWHDGLPVTSADVLFTATLSQDRDLPVFGTRGWQFVEGIAAPDHRAVTVTWREPYILAGLLFSRERLVLRPQHVLEEPYARDKLSILQHSYWTDGHVGSGPFKLREWARGSHLIAQAHEGFALGRPKIDEITIKFIPDDNAFIANILAGELDVTLGRSISVQQAMQTADSWKQGKVDVGMSNHFIVLYPQQLDPGLAVLTNVQFKRALVHAIDRQQLVDTLQYGMVPVAHAFVGPTDPMYKAVEPSIVRYEYDPRRAIQLIESLGYTRGTDGPFRDAGGQALSLEVRTSGGDDTQESAILVIADFLKQVGITGVPYVVSQAQREDRAALNAFPGLRVTRNPNDTWDVMRYHSRSAPTPENNFRETGNRSRYMSPELDALIERYMVTISPVERAPILAQIVRHQTDQVSLIGLWYNTIAVAVGGRMRGVEIKDVYGARETWNAHEWDVAVN